MAKATRDGIAAARQDIEVLRGQIRELQTARAELLARPMAKEEVLARVEDFIDAEELGARDWITLSALHAAPQTGSTPFSLKSAFSLHPIGVLALLGFGEKMRDALVAEALDAAVSEPISFAQRQIELARLEDEAEAVSAAIELIIRGAEENGASIERDAGADPRHVLAKDL